MVSHEICIHIQCFFGVVANKIPNAIYLELIKRRSKVVQEENMACEHALNFDQWKTFSKSYKPMRVWFWLVYKFTKNYCCSWLLWVHWNSKEVSCLCWWNMYPTLKIICHIKLCELNSFAKYLISVTAHLIMHLHYKNLVLFIFI